MFKNTLISEYAQRVIDLSKKEGKIFKEVLDNKVIKALIVRLNTEEQLGKDKTDSLGAHLGTYSHATELLSGGKKKQGQFIDLKDTGDFYASWKVKVFERFISIDANPIKEDTNLFDEYGLDVLGLTDDNLQILIDETKKLYIEYYRKNLQ